MRSLTQRTNVDFLVEVEQAIRAEYATRGDNDLLA